MTWEEESPEDHKDMGGLERDCRGLSSDFGSGFERLSSSFPFRPLSTPGLGDPM